MQAMVAGIFPVDFNGINKDGWTQLGTLLNKANLLSDTVISTLGLSTGVNSTPNDAFNVLANIGNVYVWRKTVVAEEDIPAGYTLGPVEANKVLAQSSSNWGNSYAAFTVASSITVDDGGNVTMNDTSGVEIWQGYFDPNKGEDNLLGKFIQFSHVSADHISSDLETGVYFIPSNATFIRDHSSAPFYTKISACQKVNAYPLTPAGTHITYLTSTNRNAYQEGDDVKEAGYVLGEVVAGKTPISMAYDGRGVVIGSTIQVEENGAISFAPDAGATQYWLNSVDVSILKGKFFHTVGGEGDSDEIGNFSDPNYWVYLPEDAVITRESPVGSSTTIFTTKYQPVTGYPAIPAGTTIEYLGVLGDKTSIETGSYVGTGTYGSGNPNTLTFRFEPKFVHIQAGNIGKEDNSGFKFAFFVLGTKGFSIGPGSVNELYNLNAKFDGNTLSWYLGNAAQQLNTKSANYFFIALG
ncbi:MAG: hypothetical protein UEY11_11735 [Evtepia gabavorous]|uniref:hypothetical protein n=1 Tax=Evtepia gabavorous TaxID=2211183 RepID=UPI002E78A20A|nr:hypothetical protein [Evtepia gabavorous]MEE0067864.1 hypothetical protein [Evtepia gabavorous]